MGMHGISRSTRVVERNAKAEAIEQFVTLAARKRFDEKRG